MKKFYIPLLAVLLCFSCKVTDEDSPLPSEIFVKYFGESASQTGADLIYNEAKKSFLLFGSQEKSGSGTGSDLYFITAGEDGFLINTLSIDIVRYAKTDSLQLTPLLANDYGVRIKQISDEDYLFIATSIDLNDSSIIVWGRINHDLELIETNQETLHYIEANKGGNAISGADIALSTNDPAYPNSVLIYGTTNSKEEGDFVTGSSTQLFLCRALLDQDSIVWRKSLGDIGEDEAKSFFELPSGNIILFGDTETSGDGGISGTNILALGVTNQGVPDAFEGVYGSQRGALKDLDEELGSVIKVGNEYVLVGTSSLSGGGSPYPFLYFIGSTGQLRGAPYTSDTLGNRYSNLNGYGYAVTKTLNGDVLVFGSYSAFSIPDGNGFNQRQEEISVFKTDAFGAHQYDYDEYYGLVSGDDRANAAITLPDGKIAVLGTFDFGSGTTLMGLMKLNKDGELSP